MWRTTLAPAEPVGLEASIPLMVFPFEYRGDPEHGYLAAGVAGLIGDNLDGAGPIRTIVHRWEGESSGDASTEQEPPEAVARRLGAHLFLTGEIVEAGGRLRVRAVLHGDARPGEPEARATAEGAVGELFVLADSIAASLLREAPSVGVGRPRPAALTTASLPALRAFIDGERRLRAGRYEDAIGAFEAAIREDTAFALAYHRLATAAEWAPRPDLMTWATEAAGRHADRLPLRERSLLEASLVWRRGDADEAERRLRDLLRMYPHDPETWYQLGEVLFHHNPLRGRPVRESETAWRRLLVRDPENLAARVHLARVLSAEGRLADLPADRHTSRRPGDDRDRRVLQILALQAVDSGTDQARSGMARQVRHGSDAYWVDAWYVLAFVRNLRGAEPFLDLLVEPDEPRERRVVGHVIRAHARAAQGRWEEAGRELAEASRLDPASGLVYRAYLSTLPFAPVAAPELESLRGELIRWDAGGVPVSPDPRPAFTIHAELWPILRDYLIGTTSVRLGDLSEAGARARALAEPGVGLPDVARDLAVDLSRGLEARIAAAEGRPEDALELLNGVGPRTTFERAFLSPFHARAAERHLRGELLLAVGRDEEALPWFDSAAQLSPYELVFLPFAHLARARIHERSGEDEAARRHFLAYRTLWSRADHAWRDAVERELRGEAVEARR